MLQEAMKVLDLFSGLGGFSQAFKDRGHTVHTLDNNPEFRTTWTYDIKEFQPVLEYDVILASPPCTEFSKASMPDSWNNNRKVNPDTELVEEAMRIIRVSQPTYWVLENVRGSRPFIEPILGKYRKRVGSRYLWGNFPIFYCTHKYGKWKLPPSKDRAALRSLIPYELSLSLCMAIENVIK